MSATRWILALCIVATPLFAGQGAAPSREQKEQAEDAAAFKEFSGRVQAYITLRKSIESSLPALTPTDLPEVIASHQQSLARKIQAARPRAKIGDIFTFAAREAFRHASRAVLDGPSAAKSRAYMKPDAPNPSMRLAVNGIYPDTEPITAMSPKLLAAFPPLPGEVAYRIVGRTLILIDVKSSLIVDLARLILPSAP